MINQNLFMQSTRRTISIQSELLKIGLMPEDITDVILTHLHFDHTGGSTKIESG